MDRGGQAEFPGYQRLRQRLAADFFSAFDEWTVEARRGTRLTQCSLANIHTVGPEFLEAETVRIDLICKLARLCRKFVLGDLHASTEEAWLIGVDEAAAFYLTDGLPLLLQAVTARGPAVSVDEWDARRLKRETVITPLQKKGWSLRQWTVNAGVNKGVAYDYMSGRRQPRAENRAALAASLGTPLDNLPE